MKPETLEHCAPDLADCIFKWQDHLKFEKNLSHHTLRAYDNDLSQFIIFLCGHHEQAVSLNSLSDADIRDFRAWLSRLAMNDAGAATRARALSGVKSFLRWLDHEGIMHNAAIKIVRTPKLPHKLPRPLYEKQAMRVVSETGNGSWIDKRNRALFMLLYGCGLRINEALSLDLKDLPHDGFLRVMGKGRKERQVPVLKIVEDTLAIYCKSCPFAKEPERPLFMGIRGKRLNQGVFQRVMRNLRKELGLPETATPHALRHSFATHLMQEGANLREIQELLGHASLSTTQRYTEIDATQLLKAYKAHPRNS